MDEVKNQLFSKPRDPSQMGRNMQKEMEARREKQRSQSRDFKRGLSNVNALGEAAEKAKKALAEKELMSTLARLEVEIMHAKNIAELKELRRRIETQFKGQGRP